MASLIYRTSSTILNLTYASDVVTAIDHMLPVPNSIKDFLD